MEDNLLKIAVTKWCDEVIFHDAWMWRQTCERLLRDIDWHSTSRIKRECIRVTLTNGKRVELLRLDGGWGVRWGRDANDLPMPPKHVTSSNDLRLDE
jgi:hypothetical protein